MTARRKQGGRGRPFEKTMARSAPQTSRHNWGPRYWKYEKSGILTLAVGAYLAGGPLSDVQAATLRSYLRQWIFSPVWAGSAIDGLRARIDGLTDRAAIEAWLHDALEEAIDPL